MFVINTTVTKLKAKNDMAPQKMKPLTALRDWKRHMIIAMTRAVFSLVRGSKKGMLVRILRTSHGAKEIIKPKGFVV